MVESIVTEIRLPFRNATGPKVYCHEIVFLAISVNLTFCHESLVTLSFRCNSFRVVFCQYMVLNVSFRYINVCLLPRNSCYSFFPLFFAITRCSFLIYYCYDIFLRSGWLNWFDHTNWTRLSFLLSFLISSIVWCFFSFNSFVNVCPWPLNDCWTFRQFWW